MDWDLSWMLYVAVAIITVLFFNSAMGGGGPSPPAPGGSPGGGRGGTSSGAAAGGGGPPAKNQGAWAAARLAGGAHRHGKNQGAAPAPAAAGGKQQKGGTASQAVAGVAGVSKQAEAVLARFCLQRGAPATISASDGVLLCREVGGGAANSSKASWYPSPHATEVAQQGGLCGSVAVCCLLEVLDLYILVGPVQSDEEENQVRESLRKIGVICPKGSEFFDGLPEQRILCFSTEIGKKAMLRQIRPKLHFDGSLTTIEAMSPHIPNQVPLLPEAEVQEAERLESRASDMRTLYNFVFGC